MSGKFMFCVLALVCLLPLAAQEAEYSESDYDYAQDSDSIMTVEEVYLGSVEDVIIRELSRSADRDAKQIALRYVEDAIGSGSTSADIFDALNTLAGEGMFTIVRENGRVANNYPDIRLRACELLGSTGSEEAVPTLLAVLYADNEPAVITAAVKALGDIGYNENDQVVEMINWIARKFDIVLPTGSLALEILNAYEKLAPNVENNGGMIENIIRIASNYNYIKPVRDRAYEVLSVVWSGGSEESSDSSSGQSDSYYYEDEYYEE